VVDRGALITPPASVGALGGITRASVMRIARDIRYEVVERDLVRTDLYLADEIFFTGTAAELTPIREVDDRMIGEGHRGPVTKELQEAFFAATKGEDQRYIDWLTFLDD
jgi:branched-chain amino acid aminotransferase